MSEIPLKARVECTDGPGGESTTLIVNRARLTVSHVVVREKGPAQTERLVPVERIVETTADTIRLDCTVAELHAMRQFLQVEYHEVQVPRYVGPDTGSPYYFSESEMVPVVRELVPDGGRAVHPGDPVEATDGKVGELSELLTDPETGQITHLVLREGHAWGNKKVLIPMSMVEAATPEGTILLHVDKKTISSLLAMPVRQQFGVAGVTLLIWIYDKAETAKDAMQSLKHFSKKHGGTVLAAALLVKDAGGETKMEEMGDINKKHGALFGAVTGGLLGLIGGPVGLAVGATAGAATGRATARRIDLGFPDEFLTKASTRLESGKSAVLALSEKGSVNTISAAMTYYEGTFMQMPVTDELLAKLAAED